MLTYYAPLIAYLLSFPIMLITLFKIEIGIVYFATFVPFIAVMNKFHMFPQGRNIPDFLIVAFILSWFLNSSRESRNALLSSKVSFAVLAVIMGSVINLLTCFTVNSFAADLRFEIIQDWKNFMLLPVLYFVAINNIDRDKTVKLILIFVSLSLLGMIFNFHSTFRWLKTFHYSHDIRIGGPFVFLGPNELGIFFAMMCFLLLGIAFYIDNRIFKYFLFFVCLCCLYPVVYSYSRSAYACAAVGMLLIGLLKNRKLLIVLCFFLIFYRILLPNSVVERIDSTFLDKTTATEETLERRALDIGGTTIDTVNRVGLWKKALAHFEEHPFFGIGFRAFAKREGKITHSLFMQILSEQGLFGLSIFVLFVTVCLRQGYTLFRRSPNKFRRGIGLGFFTSSILLLVGSVGGDISLYYNLMCVYWLFLGIVARFNGEYLQNASEDLRVIKTNVLVLNE